MMFGAVEWINDNPILDGMAIFATRESCLEYIETQDKLNKTLESDLKFNGVKVYYTIITLKVKEGE